MIIQLINKKYTHIAQVFGGTYQGKKFEPVYAAIQGDLIVVASSRTEVINAMFKSLHNNALIKEFE